MPPQTRKRKTLSNGHTPCPNQASKPSTTDAPTTTKNTIKIATWNQNTRYSPTSATQLANKYEVDILSIQEPNQNIVDKTTHQHSEFHNHSLNAGYTPYYSTKTITLLKTSTIQPYHRATHKSTENGQILTIVLTTSPATNLAIINIYGYQQNHKTYTTSSANLKHALDTTIEQSRNTYTNLSVIINGDLNVDHNSTKHIQNNIREHISQPPYNLNSSYSLVHSQILLHPTLITSKTSHIDYIMLPTNLPPIKEETRIIDDFITTHSPSDHHPLITAIRITLHNREKLNYHHTELPRYSTLSSIPLLYTKGCHPDHPDDDNYKWFTPNHLLLTEDDHKDATQQITSFSDTHTETQGIQDHVTTLNKTIDLIQQKVDAHVLKQLYRQSDQPQLLPRTKELQSLLTKAYDHLEKGIDLTFETLDEIKKPKRKKTISRQMSANPNPAKQQRNDKQPSKSSLVHVQTSFQRLDSNLTAIRA